MEENILITEKDNMKKFKIIVYIILWNLLAIAFIILANFYLVVPYATEHLLPKF